MKSNLGRLVLFLGFTFSASVSFAQIQITAPAKPQPTPVVDNDRVRVWLLDADRVQRKEDAPPTAKPQDDMIVVSVNAVTANAVLVTSKNATNGPFVSGGMIPGGNTTTSADQGQRRILYVELKDHDVPALANKSGYPNAFPRPHVKQLLDNARVTVWEYRWTPGEPTPMHFHDKDVVVLYLEDGALQSTTPAGEKTVNEYKPGMIKFNLRERIHTESLVRGTQRAVMVELK